MRVTKMVGALSMVALAALFAGPGCGLDGAKNSYLSSYCDKIFECSPWGSKAMMGDPSTCRSAYDTYLTQGFSAPDVAATAEDIQHCADAIRAASCSEFFSGAIAECDLVGTRAAGDPCATGGQCASGRCWTDGLTCGQCAARKLKGETCTAALDACEPGAFCLSGKCVALPNKVGDACPDGLCGVSLHCDNGTCAGPLAEGAACKSGTTTECDYAVGLVCDASHTCQKLSLVAIGGDCKDPLSFCEGETYCDDTLKCVARKKAGEACQSGMCEYGLNCFEGSCAQLTLLTCD